MRRPPPFLPPAPERTVHMLRVDAVFALFCFLTIWAGVAFGSAIRYLTYFIPVIGLSAAFATGRLHMPDLYRPFLLLLVASIAFAPLATGWGWQDIYLILIGILPFCLGYQPRLTWWQVFFGFLAGTLVSIAVQQVSGSGGFFSKGLKFDPLMSESTFESQFGLVFGMLGVWAALKRRWGLYLLALAASVLTLKRIGVIATVLCGLVCLLPRPLTDKLLRPWFMVPLNLLLLSLEVMYGFGTFDRIITDVTGTSSNHFSMGRSFLWHWPSREIVEGLPELTVLGKGAGQVYEVLMYKAGIGRKYLLHSDLMKITLEYGLLVFVGFFGLAYAYKSLAARMFWLYFNILMLTDNALIYGYLIFALGLCSMCARRELNETDGMMNTLYMRFGRPRPEPFVSAERGSG